MAKLKYFFDSIALYFLPLFPLLEIQLTQAMLKETAKDYLSETLEYAFKIFMFLSIASVFILIIAGQIKFKSFLTALIFITALVLLIFVRRLAYPKFLSTKIAKDFDNNLLPVVRTIIIQVESGVPLFNVLVSISNEEYGEVSKAFRKAVRDISTGKPDIEALEEIANESPSVFFRRAIWQLANGLKGGSDIAIVLKEVARTLSDEQIDQINEYGGTLNPLAMFYMMIAIIMPTLAITFFIVMSSFIKLEASVVQLVLWVFYIFIILMQIVFLGVIKSRRPSLLRD